MAEPGPWPLRVRLSQVQRAALSLQPVADEAHRRAIARTLGLDGLECFEAQVRVSPWLDGAQITARWQAQVTQTCGVSLEPFDTALEGEFTVRVVPAGSEAVSPNDHEVSIDPDAEDPPEVLDGEDIDVGGYLVEHLGLEIDPFPRKPGVTFEPPPPETPPSPFTVLKTLKRED